MQWWCLRLAHFSWSMCLNILCQISKRTMAQLDYIQIIAFGQKNSSDMVKRAIPRWQLELNNRLLKQDATSLWITGLAIWHGPARVSTIPFVTNASLFSQINAKQWMDEKARHWYWRLSDLARYFNGMISHHVQWNSQFQMCCKDFQQHMICDHDAWTKQLEHALIISQHA